MRLLAPVLPGLLFGGFELFGNRGLAFGRTPLRHSLASLGVIVGGPELIVCRLLFRQRMEIPQLAPGPEGLALHRQTLRIVEMGHRQISLGAWIGGYIHRPLGGVILEELRAAVFHLFHFILPLIVKYTAVKIPQSRALLVKIVAPIVVPFSALLGKLPCEKGGGSLKVFSQRKAPAIVEQDKTTDVIALIIFQNSTSY